ncbi:MAG: type 1 glutamine amidotransferase [Acidobacteria bacterium]|nr:type 1 glutamine amidotransferase [Acidobacteriota bacterium]
MKLGLLHCDELRPQYPAMFNAWLPAEWRVYDLTRGEAPADLDECDGFVGTGSRRSVYEDEPWILAYAELMRRMHAASKPFVGICFGHQMMGRALGGRTAKSPKGWGIGVHRFTIIAAEPWMQPPAPSFGALMSCQDQVEVLPPGAKVLASNDHCEVAMFRVGTLLGIQGHPEFTPEFVRPILESRRERIGSEHVDRALATLKEPCEATLLAGWARQFLTDALRPLHDDAVLVQSHRRAADDR